jgi:hypothetical protein
VEDAVSGTLFVRNGAQKVLFDEFLMGQISDGLWENTKPDDHWVAWAECDVVVGSGMPTRVGRTWAYAIKDNYQLNDRRIMEIFAAEMIAKVRELTSYTRYDRSDLDRDLRDLKKIMKTVTPRDDSPLRKQMEQAAAANEANRQLDSSDRAVDLEEQADESAPAARRANDYRTLDEMALAERLRYQPPDNNELGDLAKLQQITRDYASLKAEVEGLRRLAASGQATTRLDVRAAEAAITRHATQHGCPPAWRLAPGEQLCPDRLALWASFRTVTENWR